MMMSGGNGQMRIARGVMVAMLGATLVAGCSERKPPPEDDAANAVPELPPPVPPRAEKEPAEPKPPPKLPEPETNLADALPPEEPPSLDAQMAEDADASGLTARLPPADAAPAPVADPAAAVNGGDGIQ